jgi:hypothetical protein
MERLANILVYLIGFSFVMAGVAIALVLSEFKRRKKFNALLGCRLRPQGWGHTMRAGCVDYVEVREADASVSRLVEAGQRLQEAIKEAREGRLVETEYLDLIQADWKALEARYGVKAQSGRSDREPCS